MTLSAVYYYEQSVSDRIPFIADLKPSGKYVMEDLHNVGGIPAVRSRSFFMGRRLDFVLFPKTLNL
jgi:hypothetical protein